MDKIKLKRDLYLLNRVFELSGSWSVAVSFGIEKLLLKDKRFDPSKNNNYLIRSLFYNNRFDLVRILLDDERVIKNGIPMAIQHELNEQDKKSHLLEHVNLPVELKNTIRDFFMIKNKTQ
jgi:hypothetical protein